MQYGYRIVQITDVPGWRSFQPDLSKFESVQVCPIHQEGLDRATEVVGSNGSIRIGICPLCGLTGYMGRPTGEATNAFYANEWMGERLSEAVEKANQEKKDIKSQQHYTNNTSTPVLEIGCGYGGQINLLQKSGYTDISAIEGCRVRAEAVRRVFDIPVFDGDFLELDLGRRRYGLIITNHVMEHVPDPLAFVQKCSELQDIGDTLIISVPNIWHEPTMGMLLFAPHLWSFSTFSIVELLHRCGYVINMIHLNVGLAVSAIRTATTNDIARNANDFAEFCNKNNEPTDNFANRVIENLLTGLGFRLHGQYELCWQKGVDGSSLTPRLHTKLEERCDRKIVVEPLTAGQFKTSAPIEIQFDGPVTLFQK